jgi:hypothetical protein
VTPGDVWLAATDAKNAAHPMEIKGNSWRKFVKNKQKQEE